MQPTSAELLHSVRKSLNDVVIPSVTDSWARYVAKGMDKILEHVLLRVRLEHELMVTDTRELRELFTELLAGSPTDEVVELAPLAAELRACLAVPAIVDGPVPTPEAVLAENEEHRRVLVTVIESLDHAARSDAAVADRLAPIQDRVRRAVRRELDRDIELAHPTFMLFGPPPAAVSADGAGLP